MAPLFSKRPPTTVLVTSTCKCYWFVGAAGTVSNEMVR